jgi:hypothetical protein
VLTHFECSWRGRGVWANSWPIFFWGVGGRRQGSKCSKSYWFVLHVFFNLQKKINFQFYSTNFRGTARLVFKSWPPPTSCAAHRLHIYSASVHIPVLKLFCLAILCITVLCTCIYSSTVVVRIDKTNKLKENAVERKAITSTVLWKPTVITYVWWIKCKYRYT